MADKMINNLKPEEDQVRKLVQSEEILKAPDDLIGSVMAQIEKKRAYQPLRPFKPPVWLKWGVPSVLAVTFLLTLLFGKSSGTHKLRMPDLTSGINYGQTRDRLADIAGSLSFPDLSLPESFVWICLGSLILFWAFFALNRFLEKR
jgi:hypothetical protein